MNENLILEGLREKNNNVEQIIANNKNIKEKLLNAIDKAIDYLEELKDGEHIHYDASDKYPDHFSSYKHILNSCLNLASKVKTLFESIDPAYDDYSYLSVVSLSLENIIKDYDAENYHNFPNDLARIQANFLSIDYFLRTFSNDREKYNRIIVSEIKDMVLQSEEELNKFRRIRNIADNAKTENIYETAVDKYRGLEKENRDNFFAALIVTVAISILMIIFKKCLTDLGLGNIEFWILKFSVLAVGITLITYFLKQSSHYQHLADQNYQTQVELQAYPSFMASIPTEEAAAVRKELALKYFGREINGVAHKDTSSLISDQMKSTTDMVKATTEAIKSLNKGGGSNGSQ